MSATPKKFPCKKCGGSDLKATHICHICVKIFNDKSNFNKHLRTHMDEIACTKCLRSFKTSAGRDRHLSKCEGQKKEHRKPEMEAETCENKKFSCKKWSGKNLVRPPKHSLGFLFIYFILFHFYFILFYLFFKKGKVSAPCPDVCWCQLKVQFPYLEVGSPPKRP